MQLVKIQLTITNRGTKGMDGQVIFSKVWGIPMTKQHLNHLDYSTTQEKCLSKDLRNYIDFRILSQFVPGHPRGGRGHIVQQFVATITQIYSIVAYKPLQFLLPLFKIAYAVSTMPIKADHFFCKKEIICFL